MKQCKLDFCQERAVAKGYCQRHYWQWKSRKEKTIAIFSVLDNNKICLVPECMKKASGHKFCNTHRANFWYHKNRSKKTKKGIAKIEYYQKLIDDHRNRLMRSN